ncbi:MAG: flavin reductase family protein [Bacteroidales bacterium]
MSKISWKPGTMIYPLPAVLVSCGENIEEYNVLTIAWTGTINTNPPMCSISIRPSRHSYEIIKRTGEFVINLTNEKLARATDWCGVRSGAKENKWEKMEITPAPAKIVKAPVIAESPVNIECRVKDIIKLGSHDMFISEVVNVMVDEDYINSETGALELSRAGLICYVHGQYCKIGSGIGKFGWSVKKKKSKKNKSKKTRKI